MQNLVVSMGTYHRKDELAAYDAMHGEKRWRVVMVLASSKLSSEDLNFNDKAIRETAYVWNLWLERTIQLGIPPLLLEFRHRRPLADVPLGLDLESLLHIRDNMNRILQDNYRFLTS